MTTTTIHRDDLISSLYWETRKSLPKDEGILVFAGEEIQVGSIVCSLKKIPGGHIYLTDPAGEDKEGNTLYQGWALVIYGDLAPVEKALRAELEWMWENLDGDDWDPDFGGGESRRDLYQRILAGMGVPPWTAPEDEEE